MDAIEFDVAGVPHKARKLPPMTQMKIIKRLAPLYAEFQSYVRAAAAVPKAPAVAAADGAAGPSDAKVAAARAQRDELFAAFARGLMSLSDEDMEFVIRECMSGVQREDNGNWVAIWNKQANAPMFPDIQFNMILSIVLAVLQVEFSGFFR